MAPISPRIIRVRPGPLIPRNWPPFRRDCSHRLQHDLATVRCDGQQGRISSHSSRLYREPGIPRSCTSQWPCHRFRLPPQRLSCGWISATTWFDYSIGLAGITNAVNRRSVSTIAGSSWPVMGRLWQSSSSIRGNSTRQGGYENDLMPSGHIPEISMTFSGAASIVDPDLVDYPRRQRNPRGLFPPGRSCVDMSRTMTLCPDRLRGSR